MAIQNLKSNWHSYDEEHMNDHMIKHPTYWISMAYTWYDLEMSYLLWIKTKEFQSICSNRIISVLESNNISTWKDLSSIQIIDDVSKLPILPHICYQAQNLIYMYVLWLVNKLDRDLISLIDDVTVNNSLRMWEGISRKIPIFNSQIWMHERIPLDAVEDIRIEYIWKKPIAEEILMAWKEKWLKLTDKILERVSY